MNEIKVSVLLFKDGNKWVAQGLEYDIAASGDSITTASEAFEKAFAGQIAVDVHHGDEPLAGFSPAPGKYYLEKARVALCGPLWRQKASGF